MNTHADVRLAKALMAVHLEDAQRRAESRDLLRLAGRAPRGWLSHNACRLLCSLGRWLVAFGQHLQQRYPVREPSLSLGR